MPNTKQIPNKKVVKSKEQSVKPSSKKVENNKKESKKQDAKPSKPKKVLSASEKTRRKKITTLFSIVGAYFLAVFVASMVSLGVAYPRSVFAAEQPSVTKVGYSAEYLGTTTRTKPEVKDGGLTNNATAYPTIASRGYPKYAVTIPYSQEEKAAILSENASILASANTYQCMDKNGNLFLNDGTEKGKLYKHTCAENLYLGNVSDDEPAVVKRLTIKSRGAGYNITGLYAPAGEVVSITLSPQDLEATNGIIVYIGQALYNGQANNIWAARNFNRLPVILNRMDITSGTYTKQVDEDGNVTFYVGSFVGGPIYLRPNNNAAKFSATISGAVNYSHFILGYTSREEFEQNAKSTAPYFDLMVWDSGVLHSGPKQYANPFNYDQIYDAAVLWDKMSIVSTSVRGTACGIVFLYDPFVAAGAAVAFPGRNSVNCPLGWMSGSLNYQAFVTSGAWGNVHEFNHNFQKWGISGSIDEVTNNALSLVSYSLFTKISSARVLGNANEGMGGWNRYTSASWATRQICTTRSNDLAIYATLLHSFGQDSFLKAAKHSGVDNYFTAWSNIVHYDMRYYSSMIGFNMTETAQATMAEKNYPMYVPVASIYQTGRSYNFDGEKKYIETVQPYVINYGENFDIDLNRYTFDSSNYYQSGSVTLPNGIDYTIKKVSNPQHGSIKKVEEGIYRYTPDRRNMRSGKIYVTLGLTASEEFKAQYGDIKLEDVELVLEFEQTHEKNKFVLERKQYNPQSNANIYATAAEAVENNFAGYKVVYEGNNFNSAQNGNTEIWGPHKDVPQGSIFELRGKLYISHGGDYRIGVRSRQSSAVYLSFDGGKTYKPEDSLIINQDTGSSIGHANYNRVANRQNEMVGAKFGESPWALDYRDLKEGTWIYFKAYVKRTIDNSFVGLLIGEWQQPQGTIDDGQDPEDFVPDGAAEETVLVQYANAYRSTYEFNNKKFETPYFRLRDYNVTYTNEFEKFEKATVVSSSPCSVGFEVENIFDEDLNNVCHPLNTLAEQPFEFTVDLGEIIEANRCVIAGRANGGKWQTPNTFKFYIGKDLKNLQEVGDFTNGGVSSDGTTAFNFDGLEEFRYYKIVITGSPHGKYAAVKSIKFLVNDPGGKTFSPDNSKIKYRGNWKKESKFSSFGHIYSGKNVSASFEFVGTRFAINSIVEAEYDGFEVLIDGKVVENVKINDPLNETQQVFTSSRLRNKKHKVEIRSKSKFNIDSIVVWGQL